jgi:hypothetical protein
MSISVTEYRTAMLHHYSQSGLCMMDAEIQADVDADAYEAHQRDLANDARLQEEEDLRVFYGHST